MNTRAATTALMGLLLLVLPAGRATAQQEVAYPKGAPGVVNVRDDYGARGDGIADDTESIKAAFKKLSFSGNLLYFPNGTYLVSDQVWFACWCGAQGQSREKVIIKLKDNCPRFQDPKNPKAVVGTVDPASNRKSCLNMNFSTYFINFTIDTGRGNPGAIALEYMSHNGGCAENLVLRSGDGAGYCGLAMDRLGPGPSMCKNIAIEGFDYGIITEGNCYQSTFENIRLSGQRVAGWLNTDHPLAVRKLVSTSAVPAVLCRKTAAWRHPGPDAKGGFFVMLDSQLSGGTAEAAVDIQDGAVFLRNVKIDGYKAAVNNKGTLLSTAPRKKGMELRVPLAACPPVFIDKALADKPPVAPSHFHPRFAGRGTQRPGRQGVLVPAVGFGHPAHAQPARQGHAGDALV